MGQSSSSCTTHESSVHVPHRLSTAPPLAFNKERTLQEYPPLIICKEASVQTKESCLLHNKRHKKIKGIHVLIVVVSLGVVFLASMLMSSTVQSLFIYLHWVNVPFTNLTHLPPLGLSHARNINISTADGEVLRGYHMVPPSFAGKAATLLLENSPQRETFFDKAIQCADTVVLYLHGNAANRGLQRRVSLMQQLSTHLSAHVISVDYRGFGDSTGWPSENGTLHDMLALWEYTVSKTNCIPPHEPKIVIYGHSLGAAIGLQLATSTTDSRLKGLILDSAFTSLPQAAVEVPGMKVLSMVPFMKQIIKSSIVHQYNNKDKITSLSIPVLLLHGQKDATIHFQHSRELAQVLRQANMRVKLIEIPSATHDYTFRSTEWLVEVPKFVSMVDN